MSNDMDDAIRAAARHDEPSDMDDAIRRRVGRPTKAEVAEARREAQAREEAATARQRERKQIAAEFLAAQAEREANAGGLDGGARGGPPPPAPSMDHLLRAKVLNNRWMAGGSEGDLEAALRATDPRPARFPGLLSPEGDST